MANKREFRFIEQAELRAAKEEKKIAGYAAVFNSDSVDFGMFTESIAPGAFSRTLNESPDVRALVDHDTGKVIGRTVSGTLKLAEDTKGLFAEINPPETSTGNEILELVSRGDISGMSFGFSVRSDEWRKKNGKDHRVILDVDLFEISIVAFPAYPATSALVREARSVEEVFASRLNYLKRAQRIIKLAKLKNF